MFVKKQKITRVSEKKSSKLIENQVTNNSVLEYCGSIWNLYHQSYISKIEMMLIILLLIEMIQHIAVCIVLNKPWRRHIRDSVSSMLADLQWPSLSQWQKCARITLLYKSLITYCLSHQLIS